MLADDMQSRRPELTGAEQTMPTAALVYVQGHAALLDDGGDNAPNRTAAAAAAPPWFRSLKSASPSSLPPLHPGPPLPTGKAAPKHRQLAAAAVPLPQQLPSQGQAQVLQPAPLVLLLQSWEAGRHRQLWCLRR